MRRTRADEIREAIADDIMSGRVFPGVRLDEQELADRFGVSRTPVREALKQLSATGLVVLRAHKGAVVTPMTTAACPNCSRRWPNWKPRAAGWRRKR